VPSGDHASNQFPARSTVIVMPADVHPPAAAGARHEVVPAGTPQRDLAGRGAVLDGEIVDDVLRHSDGATLVALLEDWLLGYSTPATRLSYGDALGLDRAWVRDIGGRPAATSARLRTPPPTRVGKYRDLAWFRWCDRHGLHPLAASAIDVKRWQADLVAAGMPKSTRAHRLAVVSELYRHLVERGAVAANPAAFDRKGLGLNTGRDTSSTVVLTAGQVERLLDAAGRSRRGLSPLMGLRAVAIVALFTLGLRAAELADLRRSDLHLTRGRRALRVTGKGDKTRIVYLSRLAADALDAYLAERDRQSRAAVLALPGQVVSFDSPLITTRVGGHLDPRDIWALIRRIARAAGPALTDVADRMGPHVLRHFYVTAAAEGGADMTHVQADVGHASVDTTQRVYNQAARHPDRSAVDIVENALLAARAAGLQHRARSAGQPERRYHDALRAVDSNDPVDQIIGLQQLQQLVDDHPALSRRAVDDLAAVLGRHALHSRVAALAADLHRRFTDCGPRWGVQS
jgi:site-specific recombinase XerD